MLEGNQHREDQPQERLPPWPTTGEEWFPTDATLRCLLAYNRVHTFLATTWASSMDGAGDRSERDS